MWGGLGRDYTAAGVERALEARGAVNWRRRRIVTHDALVRTPREFVSPANAPDLDFFEGAVETEFDLWAVGSCS